jgi:ketosteroid isomerase-like protein
MFTRIIPAIAIPLKASIAVIRPFSLPLKIVLPGHADNCSLLTVVYHNCRGSVLKLISASSVKVFFAWICICLYYVGNRIFPVLNKGEGMKKYIFLLLAVFAACAETVDEPVKARREITKMLERQKESWNSGDLDGYMDYYLNSNNLTFNAGDRLIRGWDNLARMYRKNYSGREMGSLEFSEVEISVLSGDASWVTGAWEVQQPDTLRKGRFTLILRKLEGGWHIVHDHTS